MKYGQIVIGAPGAGKSTYCNGVTQILEGIRRPLISVNLDPANDTPPFHCDIDIRELISIGDAMKLLGLGPNGALVYCMRTLAKNSEWLKRRLAEKEGYVVIDMPGQLELYNSDDAVWKILQDLQKWGYRLTAVHMSDSLYCCDPGKFVAVVLAALSVMVNLEMPHVNVLSKVDLLRADDLPFRFDFFEEVPSMQRLVECLDDNPFLSKYKELNDGICSVIENYNLVNFIPLHVTSKESMSNLLKQIDVANGYSMVEATDLREIVMKDS
ncbi:hypothetical protein L596_006794 [Steinernema carpocapsae]|uniref:GPN-loop GTPase 2 n=1 Tax=Steinernema carpocapsae TaxID=34508 RepID=A0A4U5P6R3_STECR|nr:hypothetical protein L596_006794 [Steinernema carpocapsae]